jgi:hypothetical protein
MRFKASIDEERFGILLTVVQSLERVGDTCAVLLGPNDIIFCAQEDSGVENLHLYAELTQVSAGPAPILTKASAALRRRYLVATASIAKLATKLHSRSKQRTCRVP